MVNEKPDRTDDSMWSNGGGEEFQPTDRIGRVAIVYISKGSEKRLLEWLTYIKEIQERCLYEFR